MRCINIGPQRADAPEGCEWIPVRPASDTAMMLALAYVLESEGLADRDFLTRCTVRFERFRPYLMGETDGQPKSPEWAALLCGVDPETIRALARRMASTRTLITVAWSLQRGEHGEQPYWMSAVLAAMLGQIGQPGGRPRGRSDSGALHRYLHSIKESRIIGLLDMPLVPQS